MRTTDRRIVAAGAVVTGLLWAGTGTAAADRPGDAVGDPSERAFALFTDGNEGGVGVHLTVQEVAGSATTVEALLFVEGFQCTVDVDRVAAGITRLESARAAGTYEYTCSAPTGGEGAAAAPSGELELEVTWTGVGAAQREPLYDGSVGRFVVRPATVSGTVSLTGDLSADLQVNSAHLARESTVVPPGRVR